MRVDAIMNSIIPRAIKTQPHRCEFGIESQKLAHLWAEVKRALFDVWLDRGVDADLTKISKAIQLVV